MMDVKTKAKPSARIRRIGRKWHVEVKRVAIGATEAAWLSVGGCGSFTAALRVWVALVVQGNGKDG